MALFNCRGFETRLATIKSSNIQMISQVHGPIEVMTSVRDPTPFATATRGFVRTKIDVSRFIALRYNIKTISRCQLRLWNFPKKHAGIYDVLNI